MSFVVLVVAMVFIIASISFLKLHPFLALILSAILVGLLSPVPLVGAGGERMGQAALALELTAREFGETAGAIGVVIVLAAIIGKCLLDSGAADKITRVLLAFTGESRAPLAFLGSGYILSVPVFFDTVFFLLIPLVRSLYSRTRKNYLLYVMAVGSGAVVTHSLVPPTPGPLIMAETLPGLDLGFVILAGFLLGLPPALIAGIGYAKILDRRIKIQIDPLADVDARERAATASEELPGFWWSVLPVVLPVALISGKTLLDVISNSGTISISRPMLDLANFFGNKNFALLASTIIAMGVLKHQKRMGFSQLRDSLEPAFLMGGMIVLITSAGGALGKMLSHAGISDALESASGGASSRSALFLILMAWFLAAVMKTAQGSSTVAMITSSGIMAALLAGSELPCHMIYIFTAIGFGALVFSWMNDSGFWVVCKMSGLTERETVATWTVLLFVIGLVGLLEVLVVSYFLPMV